MSEKENEEYNLMLELENLESLKEELQEVGYSTIKEVEIALLNITDLERRAILSEIRDEMLELEVEDIVQIEDLIDSIHQQLDEEAF
jgi:hypothetical protein